MARIRNRFLQVRVTDEERELIVKLADQYDMEVSQFIRAMVHYVDRRRPQLVIVPGKAFAPALIAVTT